MNSDLIRDYYDLIDTNNNSFTVLGRFSGQLKDGEKVTISFEDEFIMKDGKIAERTTRFPGRAI